ncbi:HEAT repeat domain-containing protein [Clostridium tagluense]|uniref:HEAT repeat domain-containing protein n=1 Tax=Clostridium tagluense TaxID=360422 RepID=A0A401UKE0_9CLOT|nr:SMI1/KNR4 family protein [Clostridium tagluense]MBU3129798.1 SMI1/KNR4 family protein [Clostridium tagluense]GCD10033.1 hypothetical protein Ctaglu_16560 [Clostridium tagluense]
MKYDKLNGIYKTQIPLEILEALEEHRYKQEKSEFFIRLMEIDEVLEMKDFFDKCEVFRNLIPIWTDDNSNYVCMYYSGTLKYRICYLNHEETDIAPQYRSIQAFINELEKDEEYDWQELIKDYPTRDKMNRTYEEKELSTIKELNTALDSSDLDEDLRTQIIYSILTLTPYDHLDSIIKYLDDEDCYVQERACEVVGFHRYSPVISKLKELCISGMINVPGAAKRALRQIEDRTK